LQHQISGWELPLHGLDEVIRISGFIELFFKDQQIPFRKGNGRSGVKRGSTLAMSRNNDGRVSILGLSSASLTIVLARSCPSLRCVNVHVVKDNVAGDESFLPRKPQHAVFIRVALEALHDLDSGIVESE